MCGIAGFVGEGDRATLERMTGLLRKRGPDDSGFYQDQSTFLGHRRLSILDPTGGSQPMTTADGRFTIVYNGELYNHRELRAELEAKGCQFRSDHSDTEVLLLGYREEGEAFLSRLNGMWAFAIWDAEKKRLFASRDRLGKKPFYWFHHHGTFGFASLLTSLLEHPSAPRGTSARAVQKFFAYSLIPAPLSIVEGIWKLPAGHNLVLEQGGTPRVTRYWRFRMERDDSFFQRPVPSVVEEFRSILDRAVQRRLEADVPVGVFLSGGLDSAAVTVLAGQHKTPAEIQSFAIGFTERTYDESPYAGIAARFLQTTHQTEILDVEKAMECLPQLLAGLDEPQGDNSLLPTWLLARFASGHVKSVLSGDGADELLAGYETFTGLKKARRYAKFVPRPIHAAIRALAKRLPVSQGNLGFDFKINRGLRGASHPQKLWNPVWLGSLDAKEISALGGTKVDLEDLYSEAIESWDACLQDNLLDRSLQFYTEIFLQDGILAKVDRASMMHGLEVRSPFLDIEVVDFVRRLPHEYKVCGREGKYILRQAMEGLLPAKLINRKKQGFSSPVSRWFREGKIGPASSAPFVQQRLAAHRAGKIDDRLFLWNQMGLDAWEKQNH